MRALAFMMLAAGLCSAAPCRAGPEASDELLARLGGSLGGLRTMQTAFVQEKHLRMLRQPMRMEGRIYMIRPDRLAWHVARPIRYTLLMDGKTIRQWDAESGREIRLPLASNPALRAATDQMRQWFSGEYTPLRSEYRITLESENPVTLTFHPLPDHPAAGAVVSVTAVFTEDERYLASLEIVESGGDRTILRFLETRLDEDIPDAAWDLRSGTAAE